MAPTSTKIRLATASPATQSTTAESLHQVHQLASRAARNGAHLLLLPEAYLGGYPRGSDFGCKVGARSAQGRDHFLAYFNAAVDLGDTVGVGGAGAGDDWLTGRMAGGRKRGDGSREELERIARETGLFIVIGLVEKAGGSLYCAVVYVCPNLGCLGKRRKVMPTGSERVIWAQGSPATLKAISTVIRGVRINMGAAICWENYMPLLRQALYSQNVNLYLAPTADNRDAWLALMRTVALEGRCFVVSSNMCQPAVEEKSESRGRRGGRRASCLARERSGVALPADPRTESCLGEDDNDVASRRGESAPGADGHTFPNNVDGLVRGPPVSPSPSPPSSPSPSPSPPPPPPPPLPPGETKTPDFISRGGSCIISPFGDVLAGPQWEDDQGIIYADVDFDDCVRGRLDFDAAGSYSRNDSFRLSVEGLDLYPLPY